MNSEIQLEATASKFDRDLRNIGENWSKYTGPAVRCGFEAEFASSIDHSEFADKLHVALGINRSSIAVNPHYGASHNGDYRYWSVESDTSITIAGVHRHQIELVSPILGLDAMLSSMSKVFDLLADVGRTNSSTGLHMTFSLKDIDLSTVNVAKLALLLGEEYWAEAFDRTETTYAVAVTPLIQEFIESKGSRALLASRSLDVDAFMSNLNTHDRRHSINATKILGVNQDKQCIELRLPGGPDYQTKFSLCSRIARRFAYALYASTCDAYNDVFALKVLRIARKHMEQVNQQFGDALALRITESPSGYRIFAKRGDGKHEPFVEIVMYGGSVAKIGLSPRTAEPLSDRAAYSIEEFATKLSRSGMTVHGKTLKLSWRDADTIDWRTLETKFQRIRPAISLLQLCGIESKSDVAQYLLQCAEHSKPHIVAHLVDPLGYMYDSKDDANYAAHAGMWVGRTLGHNDMQAISYLRKAIASGIGGSRSLKFCAGAGILPANPNGAAYLTTLADFLARDDNHRVNDPDLVPTLIVMALNSNSDAKMCLDIMAERGNQALSDVHDIASRFATLISTDGRELLDMLQVVRHYAGGLIADLHSLVACKQNPKLRDALMPVLIRAFQGVGYSRGNGTDLMHLPVSDSEWGELGVTEIPELLPADDEDDVDYIEAIINTLTGASQDTPYEIGKYSRDSVRRALDNPKLIAYIQKPDIIRDTELIESLIHHWFDIKGWQSQQPNFLNLLKTNAHLSNDFVNIAMTSEARDSIDSMVYTDVVAILRNAFRKGELEFSRRVGFDGDGNQNLISYVRSALLCGHNSRGSVHFARALMNDLAGEVLSSWLGSGRVHVGDLRMTNPLSSICGELDDCARLSIQLDHHYVYIDLVAALTKAALEGTTNLHWYASDMSRLADELRIQVRDVPAPKPAISTYAPAADTHSLDEPTRPDGFVEKPLPLDELIRSIDDSSFFAVIPDDGVSTEETASDRQDVLMAAFDVAPESDVRAVFAHVESGVISPAMQRLFYMHIVGLGMNTKDLTNPVIFAVGLNYPRFIDNVFSTLNRYNATQKVTRIFGHSLNDAFYLLLTQTTAPLSKQIGVVEYLSTLGKFSSRVKPDIMFSARSVLYFKKLLASSMLHSFARYNAKEVVVSLSRVMSSAGVNLQHNRNYPLLIALAKYSGMTRTEYKQTFDAVTDYE